MRRVALQVRPLVRGRVVAARQLLPWVELVALRRVAPRSAAQRKWEDYAACGAAGPPAGTRASCRSATTATLGGTRRAATSSAAFSGAVELRLPPLSNPLCSPALPIMMLDKLAGLRKVYCFQTFGIPLQFFPGTIRYVSQKHRFGQST